MIQEAFGSLKLPLIVGAAALAVGMGVGEASAASVAVQNADFEAEVLGDGGATRTLPGWSIYNGEAGAFNPTSAIVSSVPSGNNVAWAGGSAGGFASIQQNLSEVITAGSQYQMDLSLGLRGDGGGAYAADQFRVGLYAWNNVGSYALAELDWSDVTLTPGGFANVSVNTGALDAFYAGMNLRIELTTFGLDGNRQVLYDNIQVQSGDSGLIAPVHAPTPTTAAAGLALMGGLIGRRRWNREA